MFLLIEEELFGFKLGWRERIVIDWKIRSCACKMQARLFMGSVTWTVQALNSLSVKWSLLMTSREAYTSELYEISFIWKSLRPHMKEKCWRKAEEISPLLLSCLTVLLLSVSLCLCLTHTQIARALWENLQGFNGLTSIDLLPKIMPNVLGSQTYLMHSTQDR